MKLRDAAEMAICSLRSSAAKTLLTILGLAVGVAAVLTVRALGAAGEKQVEHEIGRMGVNKVWVTRADGGSIPAADVLAAAQAADVPVCAGACAPALVRLNSLSAAAQVAGYDAGMQAVYDIGPAQGRSFLPADFAGASAVCLVDSALEEALGGDVLGQRLAVAGRRLLVVGVMANLPLPTMSVSGGVLVTPLSTWEDTFGAGAAEVTLTVPEGRNARDVAQAVQVALGSDYQADTLENEIDAARSIVRIFVMVLSSVAAVCMVTGAIGVMNVLLVSVRERRREIGLMKALGATARQVGVLFLLEAAGYAALGGALGILLGAALIRLLGGIVGVNAHLTAGDAVPVLLATATMGVGFGVAPALRAARMQVVDALRCE